MCTLRGVGHPSAGYVGLSSLSDAGTQTISIAVRLDCDPAILRAALATTPNCFVLLCLGGSMLS